VIKKHNYTQFKAPLIRFKMNPNRILYLKNKKVLMVLINNELRSHNIKWKMEIIDDILKIKTFRETLNFIKNDKNLQ